MRTWTVGSLALFAASAVLAFFLYQDGSLGWIALGALMGGSLFSTLFSLQESAADPAELQRTQTLLSSLQQQLGSAESKLLLQQEEWGKEHARIQKKAEEAFDKYESYKRLAALSQGEIDRLQEEARQRSEELLAKGRRLAELELYLEDPTIFPQEGEFVFGQLKKQVEEKEIALEKAMSDIFHLENKLALLQKETDVKLSDESSHAAALASTLKIVEEEKQVLQTELFSIQELVSETSQHAHDEAKATAALTKQLQEKNVQMQQLQTELDQYVLKK